MSKTNLPVVIVGAGFGGVGAAIELQRNGFTDITILDKAPGIGGTWLHNTYPGAACDVPSHLYSYSYEQRTDWTRICSPQSEILAYINEVAAKYGVDRLLQPNTAVASVTYDDDTHRWTVISEDGRTWEAAAVIIATGQLHQPARPNIPGADAFKGHMFHSAEWDHDYNLAGRDVAVIGTGASAVQFVPEIAPLTRHTTIFQRTGNWFMPRKMKDYSKPFRWAVAHVPGLQALRRTYIYHYGELLTYMIRHPRTAGRIGHFNSWLHMRTQIKDKELRRKIWPGYTFGCKRVLFSSTWLPALQAPNVDVVDQAITAITPDGVVTADGVEHKADTIIWGTGFKTNDFMFPMSVVGRGGRSLEQDWADGAHAHLGMAIPGYPSLFVMYGPNTNTSGGSIIVYLEAQARYIRQALELVRSRGGDSVEVRGEVESAFNRDVQERFTGTAWNACTSWYRTSDGRHVTNWPGYMSEYEARTAALDAAEFEVHTAGDREEAPSAA